MQRITISLPDAIAEDFDALVAERGYGNRSEAVRDMIRSAKALRAVEEGFDGEAVAVVSYVYNHHERQLASRLTEHQHHHDELVVSLMHVHVNREECMETVFLRGPGPEICHLAQNIVVEPVIRNGSINFIPL